MRLPGDKVVQPELQPWLIIIQHIHAPAKVREQAENKKWKKKREGTPDTRAHLYFDWHRKSFIHHVHTSGSINSRVRANRTELVVSEVEVGAFHASDG